ncbi:unnamed protein product [Adineta ricciae]|uniref:Uncharacterized protein n=1 Tax=Adineta ricciae TaxID=249248 RepID=A0A814F5D3_ADIRI|nr:unnamed protein product [Adineta ricciae]
MTRFEEKLYLQSVFDAIDQVYNMKKSQKHSTYEERLRASFNKLLIPDWYNHEYTSTNGLRKTKSHGHVPRAKRNNNNHNSNNNNNNHINNNDDTPETSISSSVNSPHLSNGTNHQSYRHRSTSRSWSERAPFRRDSTTSSYDPNGCVINGRRSATSNGSSTYAPGVQRVAQSSTWYKPRIFSSKTANGHTVEAPKPLPRCSKIDQERLQSSNAASSPKIDHVRHPIKPRTMAQAQIPVEDESLLDVSSDADITIVQKSPSTPADKKPIANIVRADSIRSVSSETESYRSAILPSVDKNLIATDSSSYASVSERCLSPSTASYHTARAGDTSSASSITGYETPTPQFDDDNVTLSVHSSLSDLSHAETLEPNAEDLDIAAVSIAEHNTTLIPSVAIGMEHSPLPTITSTQANVDNATIKSHSIEEKDPNDDAIQHTTPMQSESSDVREIFDDEILREIDLNAVGDEFFLFSPRDTVNNQSSSNDNHRIQQVESPTHTSKRIFTMEDNNHSSNGFHLSSTNNPFGYDDDNNNNNQSSIMITNLDDILIENDDDENQYLNGSYRRPIQEDILYEVEHENSLSDHSQNTSSIIAANDDKVSNKCDANIDYLTLADNHIPTNIHEQTSTSPNEKQNSPSRTTENHNILPIYILPPLFTTSKSEEHPTSLHIDTSDQFEKWDSVINKYSDLTSPSSYTSKIRHRHYSVGSYYDHKTPAVTVRPNHSMYFLGSAPVSPLSRTSTTSSESYYHAHHYPSPISYDNAPISALRRVNPFLDSNTYAPFTFNYNYRRTTEYRSSSLNREEKSRTITYTSPKMTSKSVERTIPVIKTERIPSATQSVTSPPPATSTRTSSIPFQQYEIPIMRPKATRHISMSPSPPPPPPRPAIFEQESSFIRRTIIQKSPATSSSPRSSLFDRELSPPSPSPPPLPVRPKTSRGRVRTPSPPPIRSNPKDRGHSYNVYQEIDSASIADDHSRTTNPDLQFIRGAIERVFHFNGDSTTDTTSESSTYYDEAAERHRKEPTKVSNQYPAVEAIQRFYNHKPSPRSEKRLPAEQITNLDDVIVSNSSISKKTTSRSVPVAAQKMNYSKTKSKSTNQERVSSDEIDDTLNDIEDVDSHDERLKRPTINHSDSHTSNENSPIHSSTLPFKTKATSQQTQTTGQSKATNVSLPMIRTTVSPIEIVTDMVIEGDDIIDDQNGEIRQVSDDMVIFYDDIEIVENSTSSCSSECESGSASSISSSSHHYSKPANTSIAEPPPIPARTLKPIHLVNNNNNQQQQQQEQQRQSPAVITNRTYELEKAVIRKKFDVNTVNDMINRTDYNIGPSAAHRHPSARHFVGKLNSDDSSIQSAATNGHKRTSTKIPSSATPVRSASALPSIEKPRSVVADTNALVKQIQTSLSRNSLHDSQVQSKPLSTSSKDLRTFVSSTYSPTGENTIDDDGTVHKRPQTINTDEQVFKRQARLSKSFHNVSEYNSADQSPANDHSATLKPQPSKSVENNLDQVTHAQTKQKHVPLNLTSVVTSTSFSALPNGDENTRLLSMKWYTGQVSENSEICYNHTNHLDGHDLLAGYISAHSNQETKNLFARLQASNDARIHAALDDIRSRVAQFDASKTQGDVQVFMRYLESRLRDLNTKKTLHKSIVNGAVINGQPLDNISTKSRTSSTSTNVNKDSSTSRQFGRQHIRSSSSMGGGSNTKMNGHQTTPPRRLSQSSTTPESPAVLDEMLNTVLGLPKKGVSILPQTFPTKREKPTPLIQPQITASTTTTNKNGRDIGKRLFESGTYKDPRLLYDGPKRKEKEEEPLETSV